MARIEAKVQRSTIPARAGKILVGREGVEIGEVAMIGEGAIDGYMYCRPDRLLCRILDFLQGI
jgi:hypothetical protein